MGQGISSGELKEEFNRFEEKINESSSLPIYVCFTLHIIDPPGSLKKNISKKLQAVVNLLEEKHISKTNRNHYALVLNDTNQIYWVNFCNSDEFIIRINKLFSYIVDRNNDNRAKQDLYEICLNRLTWKKSIKILANLNLSGAYEYKGSKDRLNKTFVVEIFDLKSLQDFDLFLTLFCNVAAKRVEVENVGPLNYFNPINKNDNYNAATEIDSIIKQLKADTYQMLQNQKSSLLRYKVQHLKLKIEKIEEKIKNKIIRIENIIFYVFDTLNKIYSHLYNYHRNNNLDMFNVNDELILLCRAAFRIYNKYLFYDSQCLNMMIKQILKLGSLTVNEKIYQEYSNPDYEQFINKFANSQQKDTFSERKLLLAREIKSVQTQLLKTKENELDSDSLTENSEHGRKRVECKQM